MKEDCRITDSVNRIVLRSNPYLGYSFEIDLHKNGKVFYKNNMDCYDGAFLLIRSDAAEYLISLAEAELSPCVGDDDCGYICIDGYHWEISFYNEEVRSSHIEGRNGERASRHDHIKRVVQAIEGIIPVNLGYHYML